MTIKEVQRQRLAKYIEAEEAILAGQSYEIGSRKLTRANLKEVQEMIETLINAGVTPEDEPYKDRRTKRVVFIE